MSNWIQGCTGIDRSLRSRWRTASLAAGWPFPSDWGVRAVDAVCRAVASGADLTEPLGRLGAARAEAGVGLAEALLDVAALHAASTGTGDGLVSPDQDSVPAWMLRPLALGWAEVQAEYTVGREVQDPLTGLTTASYLRTRLHEVYRSALAAGRTADEDHALITVSLDIPPDTGGYPMMMAMVLAADVLRDVFDAGETVSLLRPDTAAVLAARRPCLEERCERVRMLVRRSIAGDPALHPVGPVRVRREQLPGDPAAACAMLGAVD
ncbi:MULTISPECIES: hypothetical protein [unclassified Saccharopolyspora]|uniref:hypothetical protein n=1 Tax=unclassified Saccharopolyspora TaxID=2646250 RepID=UPI001CD5B961|nr:MULTISPECIES: hypothetical protein [unclassified Saccharopolyspora]MCA1189633.1 hypothetical protein [Saccharopolyspora sp. 6T]MCA1193928.1 hypothetical protein [Saccharopolyspora sp. 6V]MCA1229606.1 hypothetical protein [Saccharopolyspora sp. 6M]MCA1283320.1 hypothetical protein [Saccharopolyspora sp. 7B]